MPYTTEADVITILADEYDALVAPTLAGILSDANQLIEEVCVPAGYSESRLATIEKYLTAHLYSSLLKPRLQSEGVDVLQNTIQGKVDLGLHLSHYGQQALIWDTAGGLAALNVQSTSDKPTTKTASIISLGTRRDAWGYEQEIV